MLLPRWRHQARAKASSWMERMWYFYGQAQVQQSLHVFQLPDEQIPSCLKPFFGYGKWADVFFRRNRINFKNDKGETLGKRKRDKQKK